MFIDDVFDFDHIFEMHEYLDRKDYDQALELYDQEKESAKK